MADRYDPKLSVRPLSERKPAASAGPAEDPLVELARIVSGRSTFDPAPSAKNRTVPPAGSDPGLTNDLESELLNDLQASFAAIREAAPPPAPASARAPAAAAPAPQRAPAPTPVAARTPPQAAPAPQTEPPRAEKGALQRSERTPPAPRPEKPADQPKAEKPAAPYVAPRPIGANAPGVDPGRVPLRPAVHAHAAEADAAAAAPVVRSSQRWERPAEEPRVSADASRFAPPRAGGLRSQATPDEATLDPGELEPFDEGPPFVAGSEAEPEEFTLEDLDQLPMYGEDELPPFPGDELADLGRKRSNRRLIAVAAVLCLVLVGGVAFIMLRGESSATTPPVIAADPTPTKVAPAVADTAAADAENNKLIYDRVDAAGQATGDTKLVTPGEEQVAAAPAADATDNPISRVIIPGGPGVDGPLAADDKAASPAEASAAATDGSADSQIGPRKVRTVVVRPDGTIVSSEATPADGVAGALPAAADPSPVPPAATGDGAADPSGKAATLDAVIGGDGQPIPVNPDPLASGGVADAASADAAPADGAAAADAPAGTIPAGDGQDAAAAPAAGDPPAQPAEAVVQPPQPPVKPAEKPAKPILVKNDKGPIDLTPGKVAGKPAAVAAAAAPAPAAGGALVQLSAQKSEEAARSTYRDLQSKFPGILGGLQPNLQRADLGDRGVYFRVRVGPFAAADAQKLCGNLKAAGGDCIIAR
jgi:hypothetical protein